MDAGSCGLFGSVRDVFFMRSAAAVPAREAQGQGCGFLFLGAALTDVFADSAKRDVAGAYDEE